MIENRHARERPTAAPTPPHCCRLRDPPRPQPTRVSPGLQAPAPLPKKILRRRVAVLKVEAPCAYAATVSMIALRSAPRTTYWKRGLDERAARGLAKYGSTLGGAGLSEGELIQHAYEEALDLAQHLKAAIVAMENPK